MAARKSSPQAKNAAKQRRESLFASRKRLAARIGPPLFQAPSTSVGLVFLLKRVDLFDLVQAGHWPKPLVAMVNALLMEGEESVQTPQNREQFFDLCHRVVLATAVVPPEELEELGWAPSPPEDKGMTPEQRKRAMAAWEKAHKEHREAVRDVLARQNTSELKPLFVEPGDEPDDDQLILLPPGHPGTPDMEAGEIKLALHDLTMLMKQAVAFQVGPLATFHRE